MGCCSLAREYCRKSSRVSDTNLCCRTWNLLCGLFWQWVRQAAARENSAAFRCEAGSALSRLEIELGQQGFEVRFVHDDIQRVSLDIVEFIEGLKQTHLGYRVLLSP